MVRLPCLPISIIEINSLVCLSDGNQQKLGET
jgi:hypothetical protein